MSFPPLNFIDLLAILPYIFGFVLEGMKDTLVVGRVGKVLRLVRVMRILRVFKVWIWISGQKKLDLNNGDINCQTLFYSGHTKSGTYILKDHSSEEPRLAFCNMEKHGLESEIQPLQVSNKKCHLLSSNLGIGVKSLQLPHNQYQHFSRHASKSDRHLMSFLTQVPNQFLWLTL